MSQNELINREQSEERRPYAAPVTRPDGIGLSLFTTPVGIEIDIESTVGKSTVSYTNDELVRLGGHWGAGLEMVASSYYGHQGEIPMADRLFADWLR